MLADLKLDRKTGEFLKAHPAIVEKLRDFWNKPIRVCHEYLMVENYYESGSVGSGRKGYWCEHCGNAIPKGKSHATHKFYGEDGDWPTYRTHFKCSDDFRDSLRTQEDGTSDY